MSITGIANSTLSTGYDLLPIDLLAQSQRPYPDYLQKLSEQLYQHDHLVWPLQPTNGRAEQFALSDGSVLSVQIDRKTYNSSFTVKYPPLDGNKAITFELMIQNDPQRQRPDVIIRSNAGGASRKVSLEGAELSVEGGVFKVNGEDLRSLFGVPFNRDIAYAGSKLRVPSDSVTLPPALRGYSLEWDRTEGTLWMRVNGKLVDVPGRLMVDEKGNLVIWRPGRDVRPLNEAIIRAIDRAPTRR